MCKNPGGMHGPPCLPLPTPMLVTRLRNCFNVKIYLLNKNFKAKTKKGISKKFLVINLMNLPGVESRTQDSRPRTTTQKNPKPRTALPRTDPLEAKDRNARGQGQGSRTQAQVFSKKKVFKNFFQTYVLQYKTSSKIFFRRSTKFQQFKKKVLSSSQGQGNFRRLEASRPRT